MKMDERRQPYLDGVTRAHITSVEGIHHCHIQVQESDIVTEVDEFNGMTGNAA